MSNREENRQIQELISQLDWKNKKVLYFVVRPEQASVFLKNIDLKNVQIRFVRDRKLSRFCNHLFLHEEIYPVDVITKEDFLWADEIVLMCDYNEMQLFLIKYAKYYDKEKIKLYDNPFTSLQKKYININSQLNNCIAIKNKSCHMKYSDYMIMGDDIPFIEEPLISKINKNTEEFYYTYSVGRKDLMGGIYFDEEEITDIKQYSEYNKNTKVIVFGKKISEHNFTEESMQIYRVIYGKENVEYVENLMDYCVGDLGDCLFLDAGIRMISPFLCKYFKTMRKNCRTDHMMGFISPARVYSPDTLKIIWGNKRAFDIWKEKCHRFTVKEEWMDYLMKFCIIADREMFNLMNYNKIFFGMEEKQKSIGFTEWVLGRNTMN